MSPKIVLAVIFSALIAAGCHRESSSQTTLSESPTAQTQPASFTRPEAGASQDSVAVDVGPTMLKGPNAIPKDTRIVVNIPAFRMDLFQDGALVKSYKIGIGYPQYPLPSGFRTANMIIFNPTWTPPNEPWAAHPGVMVAAGSKGNPLGPIKIPIGGASLIHGGKELAKIGNFASHGCVGLTNDQVKDFARVLADATHTELPPDTMAAYFKRPSRTEVVKLSQLVPVELRYETIVVEEGKLHIYRDVYNQNTNTEENLRVVLDAHGISLDKMSDEERAHVMETLNIVSRHPKKQPTPVATPTQTQTPIDKAAIAAARKAEAERQKKLRNQREFILEVSALTGKGYPAAVNLNTGARNEPMNQPATNR
jgi:lipoprotein-anchoring transpeptidase ErfK/SrfK